MIRVDVEGVPVPQGSMSAIPFHRPCEQCIKLRRACGRSRSCIVPAGQPYGREIRANVVHGNESEIAAWRSQVALSVKVALNREGRRARPAIPAGGVPMGMVFRLNRPKGHYTSKGALSAEGERNPEPWHKPDADKLLRAILDACGKVEDETGIVYTDDAQVTRFVVAKTWASATAGKEGVTILIAPGGTLVEIATAVEALTAAPARRLFE